MDEELALLFDYQKFMQNEALQSVIDEVTAGYISEEKEETELKLVATAGDYKARTTIFLDGVQNKWAK